MSGTGFGKLLLKENRCEERRYVVDFPCVCTLRDYSKGKSDCTTRGLMTINRSDENWQSRNYASENASGEAYINVFLKL